MLFTKRLCTICSNGTSKLLCESGSNASRRLVCEFSSKKSDDRNKNLHKVISKAKNDFGTHQLNSSNPSHLRQKQKFHKNKIDQQDLQKQFVQYGNDSQDLDKDTDQFEVNIPRTTQRNKSYVTKQNYNFSNKSDQQSIRNSGHHSFEKRLSGHQGKNSNRKKLSTVVSRADDLDEVDLSGDDSDELEVLETPKWKKINLVKINKSFYKPSKVTQDRSEYDITEFRMNSHTKCNAADVPKPIFQFNELKNISDKVINEINRQLFMECTPIQAQSIPLILSGADAVCVSQTGTGKALAMILSAIVHITNQIPTNAANGPIAVILTSAPEMAEHIRQTASKLCDEANIKCSLLSENPSPSQRKPNVSTTAIDLLISTPDALYHALHSNALSLHRCSHFALYEADKIVDSVLDEEVSQIASQIRPDCQKVVWSTTLRNHDLKLLVAELLGKHIRLDVGSSTVKANISQTIKQIVKVSEDETKESTLDDIINTIESKAKDNRKTLIFTQTPESADKIAEFLQKKGCGNQSFHNGKSTSQRDSILAEFDRDEFEYLVLTDVAGKNVNFSRICNVINVDMPICISDYVNRVNRTGRAGNGHGTSYAIVSEEDGFLVDDLIAILQQSKQTIDPALLILKLANADPDDEIAFLIPDGKSYDAYRVDLSKQ